MKLGLLAAALVLVAGGAVGCGGNDSSPAAHAPSTQQFCASLKTFQDQFADPSSTKDLKAYVTKLKSAAKKLGDAGTPAGMSSDAKAGFSLTVTGIAGLPDNATLDDIANLDGSTSSDKQKLAALDDYVAKSCPDLSSSAATDSSAT